MSHVFCSSELKGDGKPSIGMVQFKPTFKSKHNSPIFSPLGSQSLNLLDYSDLAAGLGVHKVTPNEFQHFIQNNNRQ